MNFSIYMITSKTTNKSYIGFTGRNIERRWKSHISSAKNGSMFRFHSAIRKYGEDDWDIVCLHSGLDESQARTKESQLIYSLKTAIDGYNAREGGSGGWIVPPEKYETWRQQGSESALGFRNPNACLLTDKEIASLYWAEYNKDMANFSISSATKSLNKDYGVPKHLKKDFRFVDYGGGVTGLRNFLIKEYNIDRSVFSRKTTNHRKALSRANTGKNWYHDPDTGARKLLFAEYANEIKWKRGIK